jgi:hypothetical protein
MHPHEGVSEIVNMTTQNNKPAKNKVHVFLENLIKQKFGVFLEVYHTQFNPPVKLPNSRKLIRARTTVMAYKDAREAELASQNPGTIKPLALASAECSVQDTFIKRVGLQKSLHRLYRELSAVNN